MSADAINETVLTNVQSIHATGSVTILKPLGRNNTIGGGVSHFQNQTNEAIFNPETMKKFLDEMLQEVSKNDEANPVPFI